MADRIDRRFDEVVQEGQSIGHGKDRGYRALCGDCGEYKVCRAEEYKKTNLRGASYIPMFVGTEELKYVASMRAWNCCNEGKEPLDGFPEDPQDDSRDK
jgi:hypothetical protein